MKNKIENYLQNKQGQRGFTLIELLVVITLIAILAVAVLATINPVEQRRKAIDTSMKATAAEYLAAQERYYAQYGCYTHDSTATGVCPTPSSLTSYGPTAGRMTNDSYLVTQGEVKQSLLDRLGSAPYNAISFTVDAQEELHAQFTPQSKAFTPLATFGSGCTGTGALYCVPDSVQ